MIRRRSGARRSFEASGLVAGVERGLQRSGECGRRLRPDHCGHLHANVDGLTFIREVRQLHGYAGFDLRADQ
jgi:hypothetical protein